MRDRASHRARVKMFLRYDRDDSSANIFLNASSLISRAVIGERYNFSDITRNSVF